MRKTAYLFPILVVLAVPGFVFAQEEEPASPNQGRIGVSGGLDVVDDYYFRGIVQEKKEEDAD